MGSDVTKAQHALLQKACQMPVKPYRGEWATFYSLSKVGLMKYVRTGSHSDFTQIELTDAGRDLLSKQTTKGQK